MNQCFRIRPGVWDPAYHRAQEAPRKEAESASKGEFRRLLLLIGTLPHELEALLRVGRPHKHKNSAFLLSKVYDM